MLRLGYSANLAAELLADFPTGIELIRLPRDLDHDVEIEVWIPDPYPTRNTQIVPHLRGVKLVLSLMAGTEWIPGSDGAACDDLQCARGAQYFDGGVDAFGDSDDAEAFSAVSRYSAVGGVEAAV